MMIRRLLGRRPPRLPSGQRLYAVGDVHGCFDLLIDLIDLIDDEQDGLEPMHNHLLFVGDLADRGPDSAKVLDFVRRVKRDKARVVVLKGNHEEMLVDAWRGDEDALAGWLAFGGVETLVSFGADRAAIDPDRPDDVLAILRAVIPADLVEWIDDLPLQWQCGDYAFVHAGIRPGLPLKRQDAFDLLWIREEFLEYAGRHERVIVHGHTISAEVDFRPNRIGIDTGAYISGRLSALCLCGDEQRVIATGLDTLDLVKAVP